MARWTDLAKWRGPSPNKNAGGQTEVRGLVVHIAAGWYEGTIAWQRNEDSGISSHFVVGRDGQIAQMVDTADAAWTQRSGNGEWLSVECEGFIKGDSKNPGGWERLSDAQIEAVARLLLKCHQVHGVPLQTTTSPTGRGLGHHSMGADWGHRQCPGEPIIAQKPAIVSRALALKNGDDDMALNDRVDYTAWYKETYGSGSGTVEGTLAGLIAYGRNASDNTVRLIELQEATLSAIKGMDANAIISAINSRAAEAAARDTADAARDAALLAELRELASGGATADEVIDVLVERAARLSGAGE